MFICPHRLWCVSKKLKCRLLVCQGWVCHEEQSLNQYMKAELDFYLDLNCLFWGLGYYLFCHCNKLCSALACTIFFLKKQKIKILWLSAVVSSVERLSWELRTFFRLCVWSLNSFRWEIIPYIISVLIFIKLIIFIVVSIYLEQYKGIQGLRKNDNHVKNFVLYSFRLGVEDLLYMV